MKPKYRTDFKPNRVTVIDGLCTIHDMCEYFKISRGKMRNALNYHAKDGPSVVKVANKAFFYDRAEFIAWATKEKIKYNEYPNFRTEKKYVKVAEVKKISHDFNQRAVSFITSKRVF